MRKKLFVNPIATALLSIAALVSIGCSSSKKAESTAETPAKTEATPPPAESAPKVAEAPPAEAPPKVEKAPKEAAAPKAAPKVETAPKATAGNLMDPSSLKAQAPATFTVKLATTKGDVIVQVNRDWSPKGADRFYNLVKGGFFSDMSFFRIVPNFIVQFGISPKPAVARVWEGARISDDPVKHTNSRGTLVFATAGPSTRTTQLFINLAANAGLDGQGFSPFGEVTQGMDIVDSLYQGYGERPDQGRITAEGKPYLDKFFPRLDKITKATIVANGAAAAGGSQ